MSLKNARVLVIGGTSGIGLGVASAAAERGAVPIVVSRRQSSVNRALSQLPENARGAVVDLTDLSALERVAGDIGDIEHLVFTAGEPLELAPLAGLTPEVITGFFQTRFVGALTAVRVFGPHITPGGSITLTSGTAAEQPGFGALPVSICGAMNALTKALAFELAPIRVNAVAPGVVRTPLWDALSAPDRQAMYDQSAQQIPLGRVGEVGDTARAYVYCMEQEFGTGVVLTVDGGTTLV
ncbi:SDR family oxidoreductase [Mycolicibacterium moriokaense]|uniref:NAD(P)-dependent dehydrogenase (Short-subunit alcohol dehydrogenase family) n=1 Tax=Mycolicibacterium moriokaense TaxID=39691 RepID=A0A318HBG7_9MYCO|nr:SDR family oxidoreductase [Mycolicibacterium moriokaense]PXX05336.1 NAD(P)-dependent dehydrogenase (short-subunit alcohol dehydrogenase family) [Mycolicibacterium moriokaense]